MRRVSLTPAGGNGRRAPRRELAEIAEIRRGTLAGEAAAIAPHRRLPRGPVGDDLGRLRRLRKDVTLTGQRTDKATNRADGSVVVFWPQLAKIGKPS